MSPKPLVGKTVLIDKLKPELGAEVVERIVGQQEPSPEPAKPRPKSPSGSPRRAGKKKAR